MNQANLTVRRLSFQVIWFHLQPSTYISLYEVLEICLEENKRLVLLP